MENSIIDLRRLGLKRLERTFRLTSDFPELTLKTLELFYSKRQPLEVTTISREVGENRRKIQYLLDRMLELELIETNDLANRRRKNLKLFSMSRLGLDAFKVLAPLLSDYSIAKALGFPHAINILIQFQDEGHLLWSHIYKSSHLFESSVSRALTALKDSELLVGDESGYSLTTLGKRIRQSVKNLSQLEVSPGFEVQVKVFTNSFDKIILDIETLTDTKLKFQTYEQIDYYLEPAVSKVPSSYLRFRVERKLDNLGRTQGLPKRTISWTLGIDHVIKKGVRILRRKREDMDALYPSILFFLEFCGVQIKKRVQKTRQTVSIVLDNSKIEINFDKLALSRPATYGNQFMEIKCLAQSAGEAQERCEKILELMHNLHLTENNLCDKLYYEFLV